MISDKTKPVDTGQKKETHVRKVKVSPEAQRDAALKILMSGQKKKKTGRPVWEISLSNDVLERVQKGSRKVILAVYYEEWDRVFPGDGIRFLTEDTNEATFTGTITEIRLYADLESLIRNNDLKACGMEIQEAEAGVRKQKEKNPDRSPKAMMAVYFSVNQL